MVVLCCSSKYLSYTITSRNIPLSREETLPYSKMLWVAIELLSPDILRVIEEAGREWAIVRWELARGIIVRSGGSWKVRYGNSTVVVGV